MQTIKLNKNKIENKKSNQESDKYHEEKKICAKILQIENNEHWTILHKKDHLCLIHYQNNERIENQMNEYYHLKNIIVDIEHHKIISSMYGNIHYIQSNEISRINDGYTVFDVQKNKHRTFSNKAEFHYINDGIFLTFIKLNKKVYMFTCKKIYHMGEIQIDDEPVTFFHSFDQIYRAANGPNTNQLFNPQFDSSPYIHHFVLVKPELCISTKQKIDHPYLVYMGYKQMRDTYSSSYIHMEPTVFYQCENENTHVIPTIFQQDVSIKKEVYKSKKLSLQETNTLLSYGLYKERIFSYHQDLWNLQHDHVIQDPRRYLSESILVTDVHTSSHGNQKMVYNYKIVPTSCHYRIKMRNNNVHIYNQLFHLLDRAKDPIDKNLNQYYYGFFDEFVPYEKCTMDEIREQYQLNQGIFYFPNPDFTQYKFDATNVECRKYWVFINYVLSLPIHLQKKALGIKYDIHGNKYYTPDLLTKYHTDCNYLVQYIMKLYSILHKHPEYEFILQTTLAKQVEYLKHYDTHGIIQQQNDILISDRITNKIKSIIKNSMDFTEHYFQDKHTIQKSKRVFIYNNFKKTIFIKESGKCIYDLIKSIKLCQGHTLNFNPS